MSEHNDLPDFSYESHYKHTTHDWMSNVNAIDSLTLGELVLPGAHNAGVDKKADYVGPGVVHWAACQNNAFLTQLNNGARALDLRLEQDEKGNFWCQHNGWRSSRALEDLIMAVDRFLTNNPDEFIVLDFHEMSTRSRRFELAEFSRLMLTHLGTRMIPTRNSYLTLGQLKEISGLQRVMVATPDGLDREYFNYQISHQWSGIGSASTDDLQRFISQVMQSPPREYLPWSLSATSYSLAEGPRDITKTLNEWFDPARSDWASKCSIINVDFFEESDLVMFCRSASIAKANAKRADFSPADGVPK